MTFVLDASITLSWLLQDASGKDERYAFAVLSALGEADTRCSVPVTWGLEVANVLARGEAKAQVTEAQSDAFLEMLRDLAIEVDATSAERSLSHTLQLARRCNLSAYAASYLELALRTSRPLATRDAALRRAAENAGVKAFKPT
ncbi:MAG TPA: type II toxin-antitoxin system VapC family toxin [Steroidobacteraceae bacterium]